MQEGFLGYHSEWNMGSPGGWDYQRMAQQIGRFAWGKIKKACGIRIELDFDDPILDPVPNFAELLLRAHRRNFSGQKPFIALVAEYETLDKVGENIRFVKYLNSLPGVGAVLIDPAKLELKNGDVCVGDDKVTAIFLDFNNNVILRLARNQNLDALFTAIKKGLVTNPRGMEPIGVKGIFEAITSEYKDILSDTTVSRTPWTRQFYARAVIGPDGEDIPDLVEWVNENWPGIILKPIHGYSGKGIVIGHKETDRQGAIRMVLDAGGYIVQPLVPLDIWTEEFPWLDREGKRLFIKRWQTDFRCFITDAGLIGFVARFGGIPTNVGAGGGVQATAILRSNLGPGEAADTINKAILKLGFDFAEKLQRELDGMSTDIGNVYLLGPIMNTLRPRIITERHIRDLKTYAKNLWQDALTLEGLWLEGRLSRFVRISREEDSIARMAPWKGRPGLMASDGLFGFRV